MHYNPARRALLEDLACDWPRGYVSVLGVTVGTEYRTRADDSHSAVQKRRILAETRGMRRALVLFLVADPGLAEDDAERTVREHEKRYLEALMEDLEGDQ